MNIQDKLINYIKTAKNGDCVLWRGTSILSKAIEDISGGYFSHASTFYINEGQPYLLECTTSFKAQLLTIFGLHKLVNGVTITPLNDDYLKGVEDFMVLRPQRTDSQISGAMAAGLEDIGKIKYDTLYLIQYAIWKLTGKAFKHLVERHSLVCCSFSIFIYGTELNMPEYSADKMSTPSNLLTLSNPKNMQLIVNKN